MPSITVELSDIFQAAPAGRVLTVSTFSGALHQDCFRQPAQRYRLLGFRVTELIIHGTFFKKLLKVLLKPFAAVPCRAVSSQPPSLPSFPPVCNPPFSVFIAAHSWRPPRHPPVSDCPLSCRHCRALTAANVKYAPASRTCRAPRPGDAVHAASRHSADVPAHHHGGRVQRHGRRRQRCARPYPPTPPQPGRGETREQRQRVHHCTRWTGRAAADAPGCTFTC